MILDQYIDVPIDTWVTMPPGATGFLFVLRRQHEGGVNKDIKVQYCTSFDNSIPITEAPIAYWQEWNGYTTWYRHIENKWERPLLQYFAWRDLDDVGDAPDFVRVYFSLHKRSKKMSGIASSGYITLNKDSLTTEPLPPNASDLVVVIKNNASKDSCRIDVRHAPFPGGVDENGVEWDEGSDWDLNIYDNLTTTGGQQYGGHHISGTDKILPYLDYQLETAASTEPEWVRVYYKLN